MGAWFISAGSSIPALFESSYLIHVKCMQALLIAVMIVITTLFFTTWYKALKQVRKNQKLKRNTNNAKRELHLTMLFVAMYFLFLLAYLPLTVADPTLSPTLLIKIILFNLTAMINPIFTLTLKEDFKCRRH